MKIVNISLREAKHLEPFQISKKIKCGEANFFYVPNDKSKLLKVYTTGDPNYLERKLETIYDLDNYRELINIPSLVLASEIGVIKDEFCGPILPIKPGKCASVYLRSKSFPLKTKIEILKQIGAILDSIAKSPKELNLAFADVHADNFLIDGINLKTKDDTSKITTYGIDTESMKINNNIGVSNFYLVSDLAIKSKKYETFSNDIALPSKQTDIFCFIMMILELISDDKKVYKMSINKYKRYLDYLDSLGFDSNLLTSFASIYNPYKDNISPLPYLDSLTKISEKSKTSSFLKH